MSTNAKFLEDDYMMSNNVRSKVVFLNLDKTPTTTHYTMDPVIRAQSGLLIKNIYKTYDLILA